MPVQSYRQLIVWQKAMDFVAEVYRITRTFPKEDVYGVSGSDTKWIDELPGKIAPLRTGHRPLTTEH